MKKQLVIMGIILILIVSFCGCNENSNKTDNTNRFFGIWEGISYLDEKPMNVTFTFNKDNTAKQVSEDHHSHFFNYEFDDNSLYLYLQEFPDYDPLVYSYEFSKNNTALTLKNESFDTIFLTKL